MPSWGRGHAFSHSVAAHTLVSVRAYKASWAREVRVILEMFRKILSLGLSVDICLETGEHCIERAKVPKLTHYEIHNLYSPISNKEIELVVEKLPT